jgi:hypothetical protein
VVVAVEFLVAVAAVIDPAFPLNHRAAAHQRNQNSRLHPQ